MTDVKSIAEKLEKQFNEFKESNDKRLAEAGTVKEDILNEIKVDKINESISGLTDKLEKMEAAMNRPSSENYESKQDEQDAEYKDAFVSYLKKGNEQGLINAAKSLQRSVDPDGGYLVPDAVAEIVDARVFETSRMRSIASVQTISTDRAIFTLDNDEASSGWTTESGSVSDTTTPTLDRREIVAHEQFAMPKATQQLLDDSAVNAEQWLAGKVADRFARTENLAFITGDGVGKPRGFLTNTTTSTSYDASNVQVISSNSSTAGTIEADDLINLLYTLKDPYQDNATYTMSRNTEKEVRKLKDNSGMYLFAFDATRNLRTILGRPIVNFNDMADPATDTLSIACGDFRKGYQIVDRKGLTVLRDPYTSKPFVRFYSTKRVGGGVLVAEAIKVLKLDA